MTGAHISISLGELLDSYLTRAGAGFVALAFVLMLLTDPPGMKMHMAAHQAAMVWAAAFAMHFTSFFIVGAGVGLAQRNGFLKPFWVGGISLITIGPVVSASELIVMFFAGPGYQPVILQKIITYYLIAQIVEFAYIKFILLPAQKVETQAAEPVFTVGDRTIPVRRLRYLVAQEHFVRVVLDTEDFMLRARLSDVVAQMDSQDGVQPHRSWWVASGTHPSFMQYKGAKSSLVLNCGTEVPVARGRQSTVTDWLRTYGGFSASGEPQAAE